MRLLSHLGSLCRVYTSSRASRESHQMGSFYNCLNSLIRSCLNLIFLPFVSLFVNFFPYQGLKPFLSSEESKLLLLPCLLWHGLSIELSSGHLEVLLEFGVRQVLLLAVWLDTVWELALELFIGELGLISVQVLAVWVSGG